MVSRGRRGLRRCAALGLIHPPGGGGVVVDPLSLQRQGDPRLDGALRDLLDEVFV